MNAPAYRYRDRPSNNDATLAVLWDRSQDQEDTNSGFERRISALELRFAKWAGAFCVLAFIGSISGAYLGHHF